LVDFKIAQPVVWSGIAYTKYFGESNFDRRTVLSSLLPAVAVVLDSFIECRTPWHPSTASLQFSLVMVLVTIAKLSEIFAATAAKADFDIC
jgi:hypothetical protein